MAQKENLSLSFCPEKDFQGIGEKEFFALVQAEKAVTTALETVVTSREKRENATTAFLKAIGAYTKAGKPTKPATEKGPVFVTSWIMQFFKNWPEVKRPGREAEPAAIGNEQVKSMFSPEEHKALIRAYNALASAISAAKKPAKPAQEQEKPAAQEQEKPAAQEQEKGNMRRRVSLFYFPNDFGFLYLSLLLFNDFTVLFFPNNFGFLYALKFI